VEEEEAKMAYFFLFAPSMGACRDHGGAGRRGLFFFVYVSKVRDLYFSLLEGHGMGFLPPKLAQNSFFLTKLVQFPFFYIEIYYSFKKHNFSIEKNQIKLK